MKNLLADQERIDDVLEANDFRKTSIKNLGRVNETTLFLLEFDGKMRDLNNVLKLGFELQIPYADAADQIDHKDWAGSLRKLVKSYQSINDLRRDIKSLNELKRNKPEQLLEILRYSIEQADISKNIIPEIFDNDDKALKFIKSRHWSNNFK